MSLSPFDARWLRGGTSGDRSRIAGAFEGERLLVPLVNSTVPVIADQVKVAAALARASGASLRVMNPVRTTEETSRELWDRLADERDQGLLAWALEEAATSTPRVPGSVLYGRRLIEAIRRSIAAHDIDTVVLPRTTNGGVFRRSVAERLCAQVECDVVVVNGRPGYGSVPSVLLPIAGGPHSGLAADVAERVAAEHDAWIDVLHVVEPNAPEWRRRAAEEFVDAASRRIARPETTTTWVLEAEDPAEAIAEQSRYYGLTVLGAPTAGRLRRLVYGSTNRTVREDAHSVVLSVRNNRDPESLLE